MEEHNERYLWNCVITGDYQNLQIYLNNNNYYKNYTMVHTPPISFAFILSAFTVNKDMLEKIGILLNDFHLLNNNYNSNKHYLEICLSYVSVMDYYSHYSHTNFYDYYFNILKENVFDINNLSTQEFLNKILEYVQLYTGYHYVFMWRRQKKFSNEIVSRLNVISKAISVSVVTNKKNSTVYYDDKNITNNLLESYSLNMV